MERRDVRTATALVVAVVLGLALTATFALGRAYRDLGDPTVGLATRAPFVSAPDPVLRAEGGLDPNSTDEAPGVSRSDLRTINVRPGGLDLVAGGVRVRTVGLPVDGITPDLLTDAIADDTWMRRSTAGEVVVEAALVMEPGTTLTVAPPLRRLVLAARPGVFLGGNEAVLRFSGVAVEASDREVPQAGEVGAGSRPFVIAEGGRMDVTDSAFRYLGRDWNGSYGVSWTKGAGGSATGSTFEHGFMGIFAATAIDVRFVGNTVVDSSLFGINAHEISAGVTIEGNTVTRSGRTGILLSEHVTDGVVRRNTVSGSGLDGIQIDSASPGNLVDGNVVTGNRGDGVAIAGSNANTVSANTLRDNRVAIEVHGGSTATVATHNVIDDNGLAAQGVSAAGNTVLSNGDYWRPGALVAIWASAVLVAAGLVLLTRRTRARTGAAVCGADSTTDDRPSPASPPTEHAESAEPAVEPSLFVQGATR